MGRFAIISLLALLLHGGSFRVSNAVEVPAAPILALDPDSDLGPSQSDGITNQSAPNFFITSDTTVRDGNTIRIYKNNVPYGSHVITQKEVEAGSIRLGTAPFADGTFTLTASIENEAGEGPQSNAVRITIDTSTIAIPLITLDAKYNSGPAGTNVSHRASPKIDVKFQSPAPLAGDVLVVLQDDLQIATKTLGPRDLVTTSIFVPPLAIGSYTFKVYVFRQSGGGLSAVSSSLKIQIVKSTYVAQGVVFDGKASSLSRGARLTGAVIGKVGLFSVWFRLIGGDNNPQILILFVDRTNTNIIIDRQTNNYLRVLVQDSAGNFAVQLIGCQPLVAASFTGWAHLLVSWDVANNRAQMLINRRGAACSTTVGNFSIAYAGSDVGIGGGPTGGSLLNAEIADFYFNSAETLDLADVINVNKFNAGGKPADLGEDGSAATGNAPLIYLSGPTNAWKDNKGSGGGFKLQGTLTDATSSPSN